MRDNFQEALQGCLVSLDSLHQKGISSDLQSSDLSHEEGLSTINWCWWWCQDSSVLLMKEMREKALQGNHYSIIPAKESLPYDCHVPTWVSHSEKSQYIDFFSLWFLINVANKTKPSLNSDFIDPSLFCHHYLTFVEALYEKENKQTKNKTEWDVPYDWHVK